MWLELHVIAKIILEKFFIKLEKSVIIAGKKDDFGYSRDYALDPLRRFVSPITKLQSARVLYSWITIAGMIFTPLIAIFMSLATKSKFLDEFKFNVLFLYGFELLGAEFGKYCFGIWSLFREAWHCKIEILSPLEFDVSYGYKIITIISNEYIHGSAKYSGYFRDVKEEAFIEKVMQTFPNHELLDSLKQSVEDILSTSEIENLSKRGCIFSIRERIEERSFGFWTRSGKRNIRNNSTEYSNRRIYRRWE